MHAVHTPDETEGVIQIDHNFEDLMSKAKEMGLTEESLIQQLCALLNKGTNNPEAGEAPSDG